LMSGIIFLHDLISGNGLTIFQAKVMS
jgi:hypothetical protein